MDTKGSPNSSPTTLQVNPPNNRNASKLVALKPCSLSDRELLQVFPQAKETLPEKLKEWQDRKKEIKEVIKYNLRLIRSRVKDSLSRWFWREVVKMKVADELLEVERQIQRLKRLNLISEGKIPNPKILGQEKIEKAKLTPIVEVASLFLKLRRMGKNYIALCPFHQERHPSFYLYPDTNSFYCFGCNQGGDVIKFVELAFNYSFKEAVEYLKGGR